MSQALAYFGAIPTNIVNLPIPGANGPAGEFPVIVQYSIDGQTGWNTTPMPGAQYIRFSVDDGVTFGNAALFAGTGATGPGAKIQYSIDGVNNWNATPMTGAAFIRFSTDNGNSWGLALALPPGPKGDPGPAGPIAGAVTFRISAQGELQLRDDSVNGWRAIMIVNGVLELGNAVS